MLTVLKFIALGLLWPLFNVVTFTVGVVISLLTGLFSIVLGTMGVLFFILFAIKDYRSYSKR